MTTYTAFDYLSLVCFFFSFFSSFLFSHLLLCLLVVFSFLQGFLLSLVRDCKVGGSGRLVSCLDFNIPSNTY